LNPKEIKILVQYYLDNYYIKPNDYLNVDNFIFSENDYYRFVEHIPLESNTLNKFISNIEIKNVLGNLKNKKNLKGKINKK
jgi:hypothetical protein